MQDDDNDHEYSPLCLDWSENDEYDIYNPFYEIAKKPSSEENRKLLVRTLHNGGSSLRFSSYSVAIGIVLIGTWLILNESRSIKIGNNDFFAGFKSSGNEIPPLLSDETSYKIENNISFTLNVDNNLKNVSSTLDYYDTSFLIENNDAENTPKNMEDYDCVGDRLQYGVKLHQGEFICSKNRSFRLGMNSVGDFVWVNATTEEEDTKIIYLNQNEIFNRFRNGDNKNDESDRYFFSLESNGAFSVFENDFTIEKNKSENKIWSKECKQEVTKSTKCLSEYDCPYLHIHKGGVVVLNWIDKYDDWKERNIMRKKMYDF